MVRESEYLSIFALKQGLRQGSGSGKSFASRAYRLDIYNHLRRLNEWRRPKKKFAQDVQGGPKAKMKKLNFKWSCTLSNVYLGRLASTLVIQFKNYEKRLVNGMLAYKLKGNCI